MFLYATDDGLSGPRVPRRCGGVPELEEVQDDVARCSPQVRGCSLGFGVAFLMKRVFPAGAGVFPSPHRNIMGFYCVPRRCGGVPSASVNNVRGNSCSPQVRGCS